MASGGKKPFFAPIAAMALMLWLGSVMAAEEGDTRPEGDRPPSVAEQVEAITASFFDAFPSPVEAGAGSLSNPLAMMVHVGLHDDNAFRPLSEALGTINRLLTIDQLPQLTPAVHQLFRESDHLRRKSTAQVINEVLLPLYPQYNCASFGDAIPESYRNYRQQFLLLSVALLQERVRDINRQMDPNQDLAQQWLKLVNEDDQELRLTANTFSMYIVILNIMFGESEEEQKELHTWFRLVGLPKISWQQMSQAIDDSPYTIRDKRPIGSLHHFPYDQLQDQPDAESTEE